MIATISYSSLKDASREADNTARKLGNYCDEIEKRVYKKLEKYDGQWNENLNSAYSKASAKMSKLNAAESAYKTYSDDLKSLKEQCKSTDKSVKSRVSTLTAQFKEAHGIKNRPVVNAINYLFTSGKNSSSPGRWINDRESDLGAIGDNIKSRIKIWYNYEGGKEFLKGVAIALLEIAIAIASLIAGGTIFAMIAAVIALVGGVVNLINEFRAYDAQKNGDPALGRRRSDINSAQDWMRESDNKYMHYGALAIDAVNLACGIATVISGASKLLKNGFKWATGNTKPLKDIEWKDVFSKKTFEAFGSKLKESFKFGNGKGAGKILRDFDGDFLYNLKERFLTGDIHIDKTENLAKISKNGLKLAKGVISKGLTFGVVMENIVLPCTDMADFSTLKFDSSGQGYIDFDSINLKDFYDIYDDTKTKVFENTIFSDPDKTIFNKLSVPSNINISIPNVQIPHFNAPINPPMVMAS